MLSPAISLLQLDFLGFSSRFLHKKLQLFYTCFAQLFMIRSLRMIKINYWDEFDWLIDWLMMWGDQQSSLVQLKWTKHVWAGVNTTTKVGCWLNQLDQEDLENVVHLQTNFVQSVCGINTNHLLRSRATHSCSRSWDVAVKCFQKGPFCIRITNSADPLWLMWHMQEGTSFSPQKNGDFE